MKAGWNKKRLGDVCTLQRGFDLPTRERRPGSIPLVSSSGIIDTIESPMVRGPGVATGRSGSIGAVFYIDVDFWPLNTALYVKDFYGNDPKFVFWLLRYFDLNKFASGVGVPTLNRNTVHDETVVVPAALDEQRRIVAVLDEAFEGIATATANAQKNLTNARALFDSSLHNIFTQKGQDWSEQPLGKVCKFVGGSQPPKAVFSATDSCDHVRLIQIRDYKSDKHVVFIPKNLARRFCTKDDVMIGRYGPPLFQILRGIDGAYNVALMKAAPDEAKISKDYLFYFLRNKDLLSYIVGASARAAGQIGLTKETIEPYPIPFPSLERQAVIVGQLSMIEETTKRLAQVAQSKLAVLTQLKQSLLQKAFAGELT